MIQKALAILLLIFSADFGLAADEASVGYSVKVRQVETHFVEANGVNIAYKVLGGKDDPAVLMIMGLGGSHLLWGDDLPNRLLEAGYQVVLFDNRDVGQSQHFNEQGDPLLWWELLKFQFGFEVNAVYDLADMADDSIALMDELGLRNAHIVGASMGGMIAQIVAARYPDRTRTLVSIMSTPGFADHLPPPGEQSGQQLTSMANGETDEETSERLKRMGLHPESMPRQIMAILKSGDRSDEVRSISVPTLVLHGAEDTLIPPEHGEYTAELIEGSKYIVFQGMGHNLPADILPELTKSMVAHMQAESSTGVTGSIGAD